MTLRYGYNRFYESLLRKEGVVVLPHDEDDPKALNDSADTYHQEDVDGLEAEDDAENEAERKASITAVAYFPRGAYRLLMVQH